MRNAVILAIFSLHLTACGGSRDDARYVPTATSADFSATGPIQRACLADGRPNASRARCGCIQSVADDMLSPADQKRGAGYFSNPARLQEVRQSDRASDERFWKAWKAYGQAAAAACQNS